MPLNEDVDPTVLGDAIDDATWKDSVTATNLADATLAEKNTDDGVAPSTRVKPPTRVKPSTRVKPPPVPLTTAAPSTLGAANGIAAKGTADLDTVHGETLDRVPQNAPAKEPVQQAKKKHSSGNNLAADSREEGISWPALGPLSTDLNTALPPALPKRIGRYDIIERLGVGGMAEIFLAKQSGPAGFSKTVVVKRILAHLAGNAHFVEMFAREARIAARLSHAHIVQIFELGEDERSYFLAMEYLDGLPVHLFARRLWQANQDFPIDAIAQIISDAALGLHYAHALKDDAGQPMNLVHRDISPDNLMVNTEGITKILDFGLAKAAGSINITQTGEIKGKIPFMAPEQVSGQPVTKRADLYALGVSLYWLLARRRPFTGANEFVTLQSILDDTPSPPSTYNGAVPRAIDQLVMALLEKKPENRPADGGEVFDALVPYCPQNRRQNAVLLEQARGLPNPPGSTAMPSAPSATAMGSADTHPVLRPPLSAPVRQAKRRTWQWAALATVGLLSLILVFLLFSQSR